MLRASNKRDVNKNDGVVVVIVVFLLLSVTVNIKYKPGVLSFHILSVVALCYMCIVCLCLIICMQDMSA